MKIVIRRYNVVQDAINDKEIETVWQSGKLNLADFFTKALPVKQHKQMARFFVSAA